MKKVRNIDWNLVIAIIIFIMLFIAVIFASISKASAKTLDDITPCCVEDTHDTNPFIYPPDTHEPPTSSRRSSGSYIKPIAKPVMVYDVIKYGDMGQAVKDFQMFLNNKGAKLVVDGIFGDLTQGAWLEFEKTIK